MEKIEKLKKEMEILYDPSIAFGNPKLLNRMEEINKLIEKEEKKEQKQIVRELLQTDKLRKRQRS